ncbi:MarR family winged helix-turn-helix transcriptional regulator [Microbacterium sp. LRZ72]|uniref:MarR family winged helix-turn-helix transcriptional regulator n=1 Tax=Microbacterium sp. LRZ72 TaxID=2942481 RepID=UPI0029A5F4C6|nr:MarR family winged helix-turn-helix transcriptional regulator [Microbacterium sp. LRZ72]MDX2376382.1 MarR family winged helix-turn-helix transcriptional regulator [Microbacterium sp. LRZ72]
MTSEGTPGPATAADLAGDISFLLARANALSVASGNAALAPFGLKVRSYAVLALAAQDTRPSQREISEYLRLDPSQVVALVDDLQNRSLVSRQPDPADRRANVVLITSEGRELFGAAERSVAEAERVLHGELDERERAQLSELLGRLAFPRDARG